MRIVACEFGLTEEYCFLGVELAQSSPRQADRGHPARARAKWTLEKSFEELSAILASAICMALSTHTQRF